MAVQVDAARMLTLIPEHRGAITQPQRKPLAHHTHGDRSGNLCRGIRTQQHQPARRPIDQLITFLDKFGLQAWREDVQILEHRQDDFFVTRASEHGQQRLLELSDTSSGVRKNGAHSNGNERPFPTCHQRRGGRGSLQRKSAHGRLPGNLQPFRQVGDLHGKDVLAVRNLIED